MRRLDITAIRNVILVLGTASLLVFSCSMGYAAENLNSLTVIVHQEVKETGLAVGDLERIFLGKKSLWANDTTIVPAILKSGPTHELFVEEYLDRPVHRFVTYWRQIVFTGKGVPPKTFSSEEELVAFVARTPGAIGYIAASTQKTGVKVITISR